ncbi:hypothetical protein V8E55_005463 [Tylopilus felleus]
MTTVAEGRANAASPDEPPLLHCPIRVAVLLLIQIAEPISSMSIYSYINQLVGEELDITCDDKRTSVLMQD